MKKITVFLLAATCLVQWFVPLNMIMQQETVLKEGTPFKFKTQPIDPNDPFRTYEMRRHLSPESYSISRSTKTSCTRKVAKKASPKARLFLFALKR